MNGEIICKVCGNPRKKVVSVAGLGRRLKLGNLELEAEVPE